MRVGVDGGRLFWEDFEKRVVGHLTEEHKVVKRTRETAEFWQRQYYKQRCVMLDAFGDEDVMDRLTLCESCKDFFLFEENNEEHFVCECGHRLCGQDTEQEHCHPFMCDKCEDGLFFFCCGGFCDECEESYCNTCVPHNDELEIASPGGCGHIEIFCSIACKEARLASFSNNSEEAQK